MNSEWINIRPYELSQILSDKSEWRGLYWLIFGSVKRN